MKKFFSMLLLAPMAIALVACNETADQNDPSVVQTQPGPANNSGATDNNNDNTGGNTDNTDNPNSPFQGFGEAYHCRLPEPELYLLPIKLGGGEKKFFCFPCSEDPTPSRDAETNYSVCDLTQYEDALTTE